LQRGYSERKKAAVSATLFRLYKELGTDIFDDMAALSWYNTLFPFLSHRLKRRRKKCKTEEEFRRLYDKHGNMLNGAKRKYVGKLFSDRPNQVLEDSVLKKVGCMREDCPIRMRLKFLVETASVETIAEFEECMPPRVKKYVRKLTKLKYCSRCVSFSVT
jgi:hypothetical protein